MASTDRARSRSKLGVFRKLISLRKREKRTEQYPETPHAVASTTSYVASSVDVILSITPASTAPAANATLERVRRERLGNDEQLNESRLRCIRPLHVLAPADHEADSEAFDPALNPDLPRPDPEASDPDLNPDLRRTARGPEAESKEDAPDNLLDSPHSVIPDPSMDPKQMTLASGKADDGKTARMRAVAARANWSTLAAAVATRASVHEGVRLLQALKGTWFAEAAKLAKVKEAAMLEEWRRDAGLAKAKEAAEIEQWTRQSRILKAQEAEAWKLQAQRAKAKEAAEIEQWRQHALAAKLWQ